MSLREKINQTPALGAGLTVGCILFAGVLLYFTVLRGDTVSRPTKAYYTTDDGQTLFKDDVDKGVPFTKDGKEAVRAYVFTCDGGKTTFVGYLEKGNGAAPAAASEPEPAAAPVRATTEAEARKAAAASVSKAVVARNFSTLVKRPGDKEWIKPGGKNYFLTMSPKCQSDDGVLDKVNP